MATRKQHRDNLIKCRELLETIVEMCHAETLYESDVVIKTDGQPNQICIIYNGRHVHLGTTATTFDELIDELHRNLVMKEGSLWK